MTSGRGARVNLDYTVIGTDHDLQKAESHDTGVRDLLSSIIAAQSVVLIAEEVKTSEEIQTFGRHLIGEDKWLSIDMPIEERKKEHIYEILRSTGGPVKHPVTGNDVRENAYHKKSEGVRENFWLNKIESWCKNKNISDGTVVITCGHNHLKPLAEKIKSRGHSVTELEYLPYDKETVHGLFVLYDD
jgi:hypothetical protein